MVCLRFQNRLFPSFLWIDTKPIPSVDDKAHFLSILQFCLAGMLASGAGKIPVRARMKDALKMRYLKAERKLRNDDLSTKMLPLQPEIKQKILKHRRRRLHNRELPVTQH